MKRLINIDKLMLVSVFILFLITRIFLIQDIPLGLHVDEAGMAYDAWSLANFGVDRYLNPYPIYFINYGGGQSVLYGYIAMILIKIFGFSIFILRLPGVLVSILTFLIGYKISKEVFNDSKYSLLFTYLFTILPYFIMQSRFGLDCNLMMGISSIVIYLIHKMINTQSIKYYLLAGLASGLILYTYALSYVVMPLFLLITCTYLFYIKRIDKKKMLYFILTLAIMAMPLIIMIIINKFEYDSIKFFIFTIPNLPDFRGSEFNLSNIYSNVKHIYKSVLMFDWLSYNTLENFYALYKISIPFVLIGVIYGFFQVIKSLKSKQYNLTVLIWLFAFSVFTMGVFLSEQPNTNRMNGIFFSILILLINGIYFIGKIANSVIKLKHIDTIYMMFIVFIYGLNFHVFYQYYYFKYPQDKYPQTLFTHLYVDEINYTINHNPENKTVYLEKNFKGNIYYLLSTKTSPFTYNNEKTDEIHYKNYVFELPEKLDNDAYYLVLKSNYGFNEMIKNQDFRKVEFNYYYVYLPN